MTVVPDLTGPGTPEGSWQASHRLATVRPAPELMPPSGRVLLVGPHPDDEVLGAGGTAAALAAAGASVELVAVTDGEASHPDRAFELMRLRPRESLRALRALGLQTAAVHRLRQPDGAVRAAALAPELAQLIRRGDLVLAPWSHDGHPDHDVVGAVAAEVAAERGAQVAAYLVWTWHWAGPDSDDIPWERAVRVELGDALAAAKRRAVGCFRSQLTGAAPILPSFVLERLTRPYEVLLR